MNLKPKIMIRLLGNIGNKMMQYMAAHGILAHVPEADIVNVNLPEWGINHPNSNESMGRFVGFGETVNRLDVLGMASCLRRGVIDTIMIDSYAQHFDNFPEVSYCRNLFYTPDELKKIQGFGEEILLISIRGGEILSGRYPNYIILPPSFYADLIRESGLKPVFFWPN